VHRPVYDDSVIIVIYLDRLEFRCHYCILNTDSTGKYSGNFYLVSVFQWGPRGIGRGFAAP